MVIRKRILASLLAMTMAASSFAGAASAAPASEAASENALWITEIYQNDVNRSAVYGNSSDHMEFVELTNTSGADIDFNSSYSLWYEYPSNGSYTMKQLTVACTDGSSNVTIKANETVVLWSQRTDVSSYPSEEDFRTAMRIPDSVQVFTVSGQTGFAENDRGFALKNAGGDIVSYFHYNYTTDEVTSDGLSVHLSIPEFGSDMNVYESKKPTTAGVVYSDQLNGRREISVPEDLTPEGVYITEIRPNDSNRDAQFGSGSNDVAECLELTNTTGRDINLNEEYELVYRIKENSSKVTPLLNAQLAEEGCIIPAGGTAVVWCYRADSLSGSYTSYPTEEEFRALYSIPDSVPVFYLTNQNGLGNTLRGFELYHKEADSTKTLVSYYFWDGVNDLKDNKSVDLQVNPEGPKMKVYRSQAATNMGVVADAQLCYPQDDGSAPQLTLLDESTTLKQGEFLRLPYSYSGISVLPVKSIELYYKTSEMTSYACSKTTSFAIYNKWYAFIPSDVLLSADYVDYYVKASNSYRSTRTDVRRITMEKLDDASGLRVNLEGDSSLSGVQDFTVKDWDAPGSAITASVDGQPVSLTTTLENGAFFTFSHSGVDSYFKNALTCGDTILKNFSKCSEIPSDSSMAVLVDGAFFTYHEDGSASIELALRAGTYGSTWEAFTDANNDDFYVSDLQMVLTDGTVLKPVSVVNENGAALDTSSQIKLGDSADCSLWASMVFEIPAGEADAVRGTIDTTALADGEHTLTVESASGSSQTVPFTVDNSVPVPEEVIPTDFNMELSVSSDQGQNTASVAAGDRASSVVVYEAKELNGFRALSGAGDSTANAASSSLTGTVTSDNGQLPYQIFEITTDGQESGQLRVDLTAQANYGQPVQLYALNVQTEEWELLESSEQDGVVSAVFPLANRVSDGKVTVLAQARGEEYTPYTTAQATSDTAANDYNWDGTGIPEQYDFSFAWITDTQYYAEQYTENFDAVTNWIVDNKDSLGIEYVIHTGDIVDEFNEEYQFVNASNELAKFEAAGLPYGLLGGNHDVAHGNAVYNLYYKYFSSDRYESNPWYGAAYDNNKGHYDLMTVDGEELLMIYMSWDIYTPEVDWINSVLEQYPDRKAFIMTHPGINAKATPDYFSDLLLEEVCRTHKNVVAMLNGHYHGSSLNFVGFDDDGDGVDDRTVYRICTDYQSAPGGGQGYIKMLYFDLANDKIYLNSYSPVTDDFNYYDTPKLDSYAAGTVVYDIDITELSVDFDRDTEKSLTIDGISASLLTENELGRADAANAASIPLSTSNAFSAYAAALDQNGKAIAYSKPAALEPGKASYSVQAVDAIGGAVSAVTTGELFTIQAVTPDDAAGISLFNEYGLKMGLKNVTRTPNADGTVTWTAQTSIGTRGSARSFSLAVRAADGTYSRTEASFTVAVNAPAAEVLKVDAPASAAVNAPFTLTVTTNTAVQSLLIRNEYGLKMGMVSSRFEDTADGRIWTVQLKVGTSGSRTFSVAGLNADRVQSQAVSTPVIAVSRVAG